MEEVGVGPTFFVVAYNLHWHTHVVEEHSSVIAAMRRRNNLEAARATTTTAVAALFGESFDHIVSEHPECFVGAQTTEDADAYVGRPA